MVTDKVGEETEVEQTTTPTLEEQLAKITQEKAQVEQELAQTKRGLSTAHQTLTQKDRELKQRQDLESKIVGIEDRIELLATAIATQTEVGSEELDQIPKQKRQDILAALGQKKIEQDAKRRQDEYKRQADGIYLKAKDVFAGDDEAIERIEDLLIQGRLERAEARINKAEQVKSVPPAASTETEEAKIDRLANEKAQKILKDKGLLIDETGGPSAVSASVEEARAKYVRREISETEARKRGVKF